PGSAARSGFASSATPAAASRERGARDVDAHQRAPLRARPNGDRPTQKDRTLPHAEDPEARALAAVLIAVLVQAPTVVQDGDAGQLRLREERDPDGARSAVEPGVVHSLVADALELLGRS